MPRSKQHLLISNAAVPIILITVLSIGLSLVSCNDTPGKSSSVVIYTAHDRMFSEPILDHFERFSSIKPLPKYDTEATKTVGLTQAIRAEAARPRCDVWWNNEILNTIRLKKWGLLEPIELETPPDIPESFFDADGYWYGFAARARIIIVNTDLVTEENIPRSIFDLTKPQWKGRVGIAKPLFGTTATHVAVLFAELGEQKATEFLDALKSNEIQIEAGNRQVARKVAMGLLAAGFTDTDDAFVELSAGSPVRIIFPDQAEGQIGTLLIPNTVAHIKGGPNPQAARQLISFLLSPLIETLLAESPAAQIPLNPNVKVKPPLPGIENVRFMEADFERAAELFEQAQQVVEKRFLQ